MRPPTLDGDAIETLAARTLHSLLIGVLLWLILFSALVLPFYAFRKAAGFSLVAGFMLLVLASVVYLSRGHVKVASWIFLSCMWCMVTIILMLSGGNMNRGTMFYVAISVTAAWLVGERVAFISAGLFVAVALIMALLELPGVTFRRYFPDSPIAAWMLVVLFTAIAILPVNQVLRSLNEAFKQARETVEDLKRREVALQESDDRCRLAMEIGRMFAFEWNPETDEVRRSADCTEILGMSGDSTRESGRSSLQRIHPDDQERLIQAFRTLTPTKDTYKIEYRVIHSGGRVVRVQQNARALFDSGGRILRLVGITADITERKQAEEALRESEERFRRVFEEGPLGVALVGKDHRFVKVNVALCRMVGYSEVELLQSSYLDITHPDDVQADMALAERLFRNEIPFYKLRKRYAKKNGEIIWIDLTKSVIRDKEGEVMYALAMIEDITEVKLAEDALRESQQRLVSIYNTVEDIIFHLAIEPEGRFRIVSVNAAFLRVTGLSQENVVGKSVNEVIPEPSLTIVLEKYRQAIEEGTVVRWEQTSDYPAGRMTGEVSVSPVFDKTGTCTHLVGSVHDITEVKRAQEIEKRLVADLAASRDEIRALAASLIKAQEDERRRVSRELHDQICHQLGYLASDIGNLADGPLAPENLRAHLAAIRARVVKTSQETHDIAHQMHTAILDDLGLVASLNALCRQFSDQYPNIVVDFENSGPPPTSIPSEVATCLYRVAQESLQNTAKHSGAKNVSVRLGFKKGAIALTIQDDGAGFDPEAVKGHGGIGLISMKERSHAVKGELTITAQLGHGTKVSIEAPLPVGNS